MDVYTHESKEDVRNGKIVLDNATDEILIEVRNGDPKRNFLLKVFCDYEEIPFQVEDSGNYDLQYEFDMGSNEAKIIPISIKDIDDTTPRKLMVSLILSPEKSLEPPSPRYALTLKYDLITSNTIETTYNKDTYFEKPEQILETENYINFMINNDFEVSDTLYLPPNSVDVKRGEDFRLAYRLDDFENANNYMIVATLGWKQLDIDGEPYKLLQIPSTGMGYGSLNFKAPEESGLYEFGAYIIPNPFELESQETFIPLSTSFRFTINVE